MTKKAVSLTGSIILILVVLTIGVSTWNSKKRLETSLEYLMAQLVISNYEVKSRYFENSITDPGGEWWLILGDRHEFDQSLESKLQRADQYDFLYFKKEVQSRFPNAPSLDSFSLYRSELVLGRGTVCEISHCNVYILFSETSKDMFLAISKT